MCFAVTCIDICVVIKQFGQEDVIVIKRVENSESEVK